MTTASAPHAASAPGLLADGDSQARLQRLSGKVQLLRTRRGSSGGSNGEYDRWLLIGGGIALPLGLLMVVLGWLGASRTVLLFEQLPYLLSGGLIGLSLVIVGGFVYFSYWQTLLVRETRALRGDLTASLLRVEALLAAGNDLAVPAQRAEPADVEPDAPTVASRRPSPRRGGSNGSGRGTGGGVAVAAPVVTGHRLVATATGSMMHRTDCVAVNGRDGLREVSADTPGLNPCRLCEPLFED